jgi:hypothetical protein
MNDSRPTPPATKELLLPHSEAFSDDSSISERIDTPDTLQQPQSRPLSRLSSPFAIRPAAGSGGGRYHSSGENSERAEEADTEAWVDWNVQGKDGEEEDSDLEMPSDLRPSLDRHNDGRSHQPLLSATDGQPNPYDSPLRPTISRKSTFHERDPVAEAAYATKRRYSYAAFFLVLSLISFAVQTETAVYIQSQLHWEKAYCML